MMSWIVNVLGFFFGELFRFLKNHLFNASFRFAWFSFYSFYKIAAIVVFVSFFTSLIFLFRNAIKLFFTYIDYLNGMISGGGHDIIRVGFGALKTLRFFEALSDCLSVFYPVLALFFSIWFLKIFLAFNNYKVNTISEITRFFFTYGGSHYKKKIK